MIFPKIWVIKKYQVLCNGIGNNETIKSLFKMQHTKYKFTLPHEYQGEMLEPSSFCDKYSRRISRFLEVGRNPNLQKVFVRLGTNKEIEKNGKIGRAHV